MFTISKANNTIGGLAMLLLLFVCTTSAQAHKVSLFAWVEGETVYTQSKFSAGRAAKKAQVYVYSLKDGEELIEGQTDDKGKFAFPIPAQGGLRIVLLAGMGHRAEWVLSAEELASGRTPATSAAPVGQESVALYSADELEQAIDKALDKKLKPVISMLARLRQRGPTLQDILGGIGYIMGLAGLVAYLRYRKEKD